jgi:hypothetical protein
VATVLHREKEFNERGKVIQQFILASDVGSRGFRNGENPILEAYASRRRLQTRHG